MLYAIRGAIAKKMDTSITFISFKDVKLRSESVTATYTLMGEEGERGDGEGGTRRGGILSCGHILLQPSRPPLLLQGTPPPLITIAGTEIDADRKRKGTCLSPSLTPHPSTLNHPLPLTSIAGVTDAERERRAIARSVSSGYFAADINLEWGGPWGDIVTNITAISGL